MRRTAWTKIAVSTFVLAASAQGCGSKPAPTGAPEPLTREQLLNPGVCATCHPDQYREWSGSMHAYAGEDPVFLAMNRRMQRETRGTMASFCVQCHAPMALRLGATKDGTNLAEVAAELRGVTCFFCHAVERLDPPHRNNPSVLAGDGVMRAEIRDPMPKIPHGAGHSPLLDQSNEASSVACGGCHDIVTPAGVQLERTFLEWRSSRFGFGSEERKNCGQCHMKARPGRAANVDGAPERTVHDHSMAAVDLAMTPFAEEPSQRAASAALLRDAVKTRLCVRATPTGADVIVTVLPNALGHSFPSGSAQDRRAWVELEATRAGSVLLSSGKIADAQPIEPGVDPSLFVLGDRLFDATGNPTHMFWDAVRFETKLLSSETPPSPTLDGVAKTYAITGAVPDRVTIRVRLRALDRALLDDLVRSGDLDAVFAARAASHTLGGTELAWVAAGGVECVGE